MPAVTTRHFRNNFQYNTKAYRKNLKTKIKAKIYMAGVSFLVCPHNRLIKT